MSSMNEILAPKQQQLPEDEFPDADDEESYPPTISVIDSAPEIDVWAFCRSSTGRELTSC
jgi:hypothetical protein